jgi:hypothetical protein
MIYIGKINNKDFKEYIKPAYVNYNNIEITKANETNKVKELLIYYIRLYYKNNNINLPICKNFYKFNILCEANIKFIKINIIHNEDITFYLCIKTRKLYYT